MKFSHPRIWPGMTQTAHTLTHQQTFPHTMLQVVSIFVGTSVQGALSTLAYSELGHGSKNSGVIILRA